MFKSIRWTVQLWHAGILLVALACFGTAMYAGMSSLEFQRVDAELKSAAYELARLPPGPPPERRREFMITRSGPNGRYDFQDLTTEPSSQPHGPRDGHDRGGPHHGDQGEGPRIFVARMEQLPSDILRRFGQDEHNQPYYVVWRSDGSIVRASSDDLQIPTPILATGSINPRPKDDPPQFRQRGDLREWIVPGPFATSVLVGRSVRPEIDDLHHLALILIGAGAGVLAIGLAGGFLLSTRAIRPIRTITDTARSISANDLSRRIDLEETQSELGTLAQTLNETFDRLDTAFQRQVQFTADASHELRTPLTVIHSHTELALTKERTAEEYRQTLEACLRASRRMKSLVESLLVLARADAGKLDLKPTRFDLKQLAEECIQLVVPLTQEKNISVESNLHAVEITADRTRISQLLTNLLSNAIRYNRAQGHVTLSIAQEDSQALITVSDTGVGMSPEDQKHVFERFFRADKARSREAGGSGLGLAICQSIVEAHRGTVSFSSKPNEGTSFQVRLPVAPVKQ